MVKVFYESDYALLTYSKEDKLVELFWKCNYPEEEYHMVFNTAITFAASNKVDFFLSDLTNSGAVSLINFQWLKNNIVPKAMELGIKKIGLILNDELFKKIYADSIRSSIIKNKISINYFNGRDDAINWFKTE